MPTSKSSAAAALTLSPYLIVRDAARAIDFYTKAFGAQEQYRLAMPSGKVGHAELTIGNATIMLADEHPDFGALSPPTIGGSPVRLHLTVDDADAAVERAVAAGATIVRPLKNEFYGERTAMILDPFGHSWHVAAHVEDVTPEEMQRRVGAALQS